MEHEHSSPRERWLSPQPPIVEPAAFSRDIEPRDAIVCFSERIFSGLVDAFGIGAAEDGPRLPGALAGKMDDDIAIYRGCFGAPAAVALMEALIASGVKRIVMVGQAGAVSPQCRIGDLFLPAWGLREEGTSHHYAPADAACQATPRLLAVIRRCLRDSAFREGGVWTTDALFRETFDKVQRHAAAGALAVEMECAALMAVAAVRGVDFAAALVITDELFSGEWVPGFRRPEVTRAQGRLCRALADGFQNSKGFRTAPGT